MKVLMIDDNKTDCRTVARGVDSLIDIIAVSALQEGLARARAETFDAILLDLRMPDASEGFSLNHVQELRSAQDCPIVVLSGSRDPQNIRRAIEMGVDGYVDKHVLPDAAVQVFIELYVARAKWLMRKSHDKEMRTRRVLLVEDEADTCRMFQVFVGKYHCVVDCAYTAMDGLKLAMGNAYDLIVLDIRLPDRDGVELFGTLRQKIGHGTPVVFFSNYTDTGDYVKRASAIGYTAFIPKPLMFTELYFRSMMQSFGIPLNEKVRQWPTVPDAPS